MAEIGKYIYVIIIFISLFFITMSVEGWRCKKTDDCIKIEFCKFPKIARCTKPKFLFLEFGTGFCTCDD
ncbi:putative Late nodulin [Medicago truncatula]|uniref:Late nodulin n=1 Tax=Medicago truncatula TaxID=3880 RepID=G7L4C1_MEDTR|nr:late nodulin [Medicago truncatula]RHN45048.1 putative Late nodulin [Medicago truncatula]